jgi:NADPH:quinone reductase-like Zn-dependent oxidoreductase
MLKATHAQQEVSLQNKKSKNVLVIGADSQIGSALIKHLRKKT